MLSQQHRIAKMIKVLRLEMKTMMAITAVVMKPVKNHRNKKRKRLLPRKDQIKNQLKQYQQLRNNKLKRR